MSWLLSHSKGLQMFLSIRRSIYLIANVTFFESKPEIFTSIFSSVSEDDYDYLFYQETLINSGRSTSENETGKDPFRLQVSLQVYTRRTTPTPMPMPVSVPSPAQESTENVNVQLPGSSTTDDLPIAL